MPRTEATGILKFFREQPIETARLLLKLAQDELDERMANPTIKRRGRPRGSRNRAKEAVSTSEQVATAVEQ